MGGDNILVYICMVVGVGISVGGELIDYCWGYDWCD